MSQLRLIDLLREDPGFLAWTKRVPELKAVTSTPPWRLFIQKEEGGRWARKDFPSYPEAYDALKLRLPSCYDAAIHCKPHPFAPPIFKKGEKKFRMKMPAGHEWCSHCRRPTVFRFFGNSHPNLGRLYDTYLRCTICGIRLEALKKYR